MPANNIETWYYFYKHNMPGYPRPTSKVPRKMRRKEGKRFLAKLVPIPWQSISHFEKGGFLEVNPRNEYQVFRKDLCAYCGIKIGADEPCARWISPDPVPTADLGLRVPSDIHPFHQKCMKEGRTYCPFMRDVPEEQFEYGPFWKLKENAIKQLQNRS